MTAVGDARVCPHCGEPPGEGVFCAACGRNLAASRPAADARRSGRSPARADDRPLSDRCAEATAAFLAAMHAAGDPGTKRTQMSGSGWRRRHVDGLGASARSSATITFRPSATSPASSSPSTGTFHVLDNEVRGYGTRDFPAYEHTVAPDPIEMPVEPRLIAELGTVLAANGLA